MAPTKRQLQKKNKELKEKLANYESSEPTQPQDIINWLSAQARAPHPLDTSVDTMMLWLEAMGTGASRINLQRRVGQLMQLWREQAIPNTTFTSDQQERWIAERGADMRPVVLTTTWQQYLLARENGEGEEKKEEDMQSNAGLDFSSIESIDTPPVEDAASAPTRDSVTVTETESPSVRRIRYVPGPFRYAAGPLPDLFSGHEKL